MNTRDARSLIADAIPTQGGTWADVGAGEGTFTRALVQLLGPEGRVYAIDRDANALASLAGERNVTTVVADFTKPFELPDALDGMLLANALHFVRDPAPVLKRLASRVKTGGRVVFVEYDRRGKNPWVPYPIVADELSALTAEAGLSAPTVVARRPSAYSGELYVAVSERVEGTV